MSQSIGSPAGLPWYERPLLDYVVVACLVGGHLALVLWRCWGDVLAWGGPEQRVQAYVFSGTVATLMLTVASASLALFVGGQGPRMTQLRREVREHGLDLIVCVVPALLLLTLVSLIGVLIDIEDGSNAWIRWPFEAALVLAIYRSARAAVIYGDATHGTFHDTLWKDEKRSGPGEDS